jgi:hypothetical protein
VGCAQGSSGQQARLPQPGGFEGGVPVRERLPANVPRRENVGITFDRYGHLMPGSEAEARDRLNAYLRGEG